MELLCDVHISYKTVKHLNSLGYKAIHVNNILNKWFSSDKEICEFADLNNLVVVTKDSDFRDSFYINRTPKKLIKINLGNCSNRELNQIFTNNLKDIEKLFVHEFFIVEIDKENIQFNIQE